MAGLSGIVKKISDLVTGTPADDDCFIFGKSDLKKITLAKLKDALALPVEQIEDATGRSAIKFANGTMIQKRRLVIDNSGAFSAWGSSGLYYLRYGLGTYLEEFSDFPAVVVGVENAANILVGNVVSATRQRPGEIVLIKINSGSVAITLNYIAIGRWK